MKRWLSGRWGLVIIVLLVGVLAACGGSPSTNISSRNGGAASARVKAAPRAKATQGKKKTAKALPNEAALPVGQVNVGETVSVAELPDEAQFTLQLIQKGGPFSYKQDGEVFQNREGHLPKRATGYYHEYTVVTPGASNRATRRIIVGSQGEFYYTDDHYDSFKVIQPE